MGLFMRRGGESGERKGENGEGEGGTISNVQCPISNDQGKMEAAGFPRCGKMFSTVWKTFVDFFHGMENFSAFFPQHGRNISTVWKTWKEGRRVREGCGVETDLIHPWHKAMGGLET
jgi:hypothetical protein